VADYYSQEVMNIITGDPSEVESGYQAMLARMRELGLDKLNAFYTKKWNEKSDMIEMYKADIKQYF
jgi:hypothetical protein